jgi:hypothetical protein
MPAKPYAVYGVILRDPILSLGKDTKDQSQYVNYKNGLAMNQIFPLSHFLCHFLLLGCCSAFCNFKAERKPLLAPLFGRRAFREEPAPNDDEDDENEDFLEVDASRFKVPRFLTFGLNGRSAPAQRKAIGLSRSSNATIHYCENCGTEYVQWVGRCSTCQQWNTLRSHSVPRRTADEILREREKTLNAQDEDASLFDDSTGDTLEMISAFDVEEYRNNLNGSSADYSEMDTNRLNAVEGRAMTISGGKPVAVDALVVAGSGLRSAVGIDLGRLCRTLAIMQKKFGIDFRKFDVYVECSAQVGHSADLAVMGAVMSSLSAVPVRTDSFLIGKIDLLGGLQPIDEENDLSSFSRIVCANEKEFQGNTVLCQSISEALDQVLVRRFPKL